MNNEPLSKEEHAKLSSLSIELRRKVMAVFKDFYGDKELNLQQTYLINCITFSSIIGEICHYMFKKNVDLKYLYEFIDEVCYDAKAQLKFVRGLLNDWRTSYHYLFTIY